MILFKKMLRDISVHKVSFAAIFFMMGMGLFIFSGISSEYHGMEVESTAFQEETNMADAWIYGLNIPIETLRQDPQLQLQENMVLEEKQPEHDAVLTIHVIKEHKISTMKITEGEPLSSDINGVWIDADFAKAHGWKLHDEFHFVCNGISYTKEIAGFGYASDHIYQVNEGELLSNHEKKGYLYVYANQIDLPFYANEVTIRSENDHLKPYLLDQMKDFQGTIVLQQQHPSYIMLKDEIKQHKEIGLIFAVSFLFIAILVSITTIHRLMHAQRTQIGILKALGFSRRKLYLHYMSHCTLITLLASYTGSMLGQLILPSVILPIIKDMYALPELRAHPLPYTFLVPVACALCATLISYLVCRSYLHTNASEILSGRSTSRQHQAALPAICQQFSFASRWNLRDLLRNPLRGFMTLLGVCGCTALLFSAMGLSTTMTHLTKWNYSILETYDCKMTGNFQDETKKTAWIQAMQADELMESSVEIKHENQKEDVALTAFSDQRYLHLALDLNTLIELDDTGIAVSKKVADSLDLKKGDTLFWRLIGTSTWYQDTITAIIRTPLTQGITMSQAHLEEQGAIFTTTSLIGNSISKHIQDPDITSIQYREDLHTGIDTLLEATTMLIMIFFLAAVSLGSIILYNLGTLSYLERYRELATLKVLGFQDARIRKILIQQNIWLTIAGILCGFICGYGLLLFMMSTIQDAMDILVYVPSVIYLIAALGTLLLSWIIAILVSKKIRKLNMAEALKAQE